MADGEKKNPIPKSPKKPGKSKDSNKGGDYEIGYGKPPKAHQFKSGQSGYPTGREKGSKNLKTDLEEELAERFEVTEAGRKKKISKQRGMLKAHIGKAIRGDSRSANIIFGLMLRLIDGGEAESEEEPLSAADHEILEIFLARFGKSRKKKKKE